MTSVNSGSPLVKVPVLSKTIAFIWCAICSDSALFINMPFSAPMPVPTITAVGVASPKAHGQAMIKTAINTVKAKTNPAPANNHVIKARIPMTITVGTK